MWRIHLVMITLASFGASFAMNGRTNAQQPESVGGLGDPSAWRIVGARTIGPAAVRQALRRDAMVQVALTPGLPLRDLEQTIARRLALGCEHGGYAQPSVSVEQDSEAEQLIITVDEGPRYRAGPVILRGEKPDDADALIRSLTEARPGERTFAARVLPDGRSIHMTGWQQQRGSGAVEWPVGEPAPLDEYTHRLIQRAVLLQLESRGHFWPSFRIEHDFDDQAGRVDCIVTIDDLGPRAKLGQVSFEGLTRHTADQLRQHLGLAEGMPLTFGTVRAIYQKLWASGRFYRHDLMARPRPDGDRVDLAIRCLECPDVPPVGQPLNPPAKAMLKLQQWLDEQNQADYIFTIHGPWLGEGRLDATLNARRGALVEWFAGGDGGSDGLGPEAGSAADAMPRFALSLLPEQMQVLLPEQGVGWALEQSPGGVYFELSIGPSEDPTAGQPQTLGFGLGFKRWADHERAAIEARLDFAPVSFAQSAYRDGTTATVTEGRLVYQRKTVRIEADAQTGELHRMIVGIDENMRFELTARKAAFARRIERLHEATDLAQPAAIEQSVGPIGAFVAEGLARRSADGTLDDRENRLVREAMAQLLSPDVIQPIAEGLSRLKRDDGGLVIPLDIEAMALGRQPATRVFLAGLFICDDAFARGRWPWTISRQALLMLGGEGGAFQNELRRLYTEPTTGPLGLLCEAKLVARVNQQVGQVVARRGLSRLDDAHLAADAHALFTSDQAWACRALAACFARFDRLETEQRQALTELLGDRGVWLGHLAELSRYAKAPPDAPPGFSDGLKRDLRRLLEALAGQ